MGQAAKSAGNEPAFDVVHPVSRRPAVARSGNAGLPGLAGRKIALIWDSLFRGDDVFRLVAGHFKATAPGVEFIGHEVFGDISQPERLDQVPGRLAELGADAAIVATGG
jgi:hypothetical protein